MANGGFNQKGQGSRFFKPYDTSNSFVKKITSKVGGVAEYLGKWFNPSDDTSETIQPEESTSASTYMTEHKRIGDHVEPPLAKRIKLPEHEPPTIKSLNLASRYNYGDRELFNSEPSTSSGVFHTRKRNFDMKKCDDYIECLPGPSGIQTEKYIETTSVQSSSQLDVKINGDNQSESSESTSGCSSLVPQSDRLSQSAFIGSSKRRAIEERLSRGRQQKSKLLHLDRSYPRLGTNLDNSRQHSFDASVYGTPILTTPNVKEKVISSPFYSGQTSYGGSAAYRRSLSRSSIFNESTSHTFVDRRDKVQVKPSLGSTEDLSNMSQTAKKILEALEEFSTPVKDAKRIPMSTQTSFQQSKRKRMDDSIISLSSPKTPLNPNAGPPIRGLSVPTVPDLIKLKRLERIQNSTAAARLVSVPKAEYTLPPQESNPLPTKTTGKMVTKLKDREKGKELMEETVAPINLPNIGLPITNLPKFELSIPQPISSSTSTPSKSQTTVTTTSSIFTYSTPIPIISSSTISYNSTETKFKFSSPLSLSELNNETRNCVKTKCVPVSENKSNFSFTNVLSEDALSKLKRKTVDNKSEPNSFTLAVKELKSGSVLDALGIKKNVETEIKTNSFGDQFKPAKDTWECDVCLVRNKNTDKNCVACTSARTSSKPSSEAPITGFGDKFKPSQGSWSCKDCYVSNNATAVKCVACEALKPGTTAPVTGTASFGDQFKKKANEWECSVCMIRNQDTKDKCAACETPRPGAKKELPSTSTPQFNFGVPANASSGFGDQFKKKTDEWECTVCMIRNKSTDDRCVACESVKPGAKVETSSSNSSSLKFNFGIPASSGTFKFGVEENTPLKNTNSNQVPSGFRFGESQTSSTTASTTTPTFTFGIPKTAESSTPVTSTPPKVASISPKPAVEISKPVDVILEPSKPIEVSKPTETVSSNIAPMFQFGAPKPVSLPSTTQSISSSKPEEPKSTSTPFVFGQPLNSKQLFADKQNTSLFSFNNQSSVETKTTQPSTLINNATVSAMNTSETKLSTVISSSTTTTTFSFGATKPVVTSAESSLFQFGKKSPPGGENNKNTFAFGASTTATTTPSPFGNTTLFNDSSKPSFGTSTVPASSSNFTFGSSLNKQADAPTPFGQNAVNSTSNTTIGFTSATPSLAQSSIAFGSNTQSLFSSPQPATMQFQAGNNNATSSFSFNANNQNTTPAFGSGAANTSNFGNTAGTGFGSFKPTTTETPKSFIFGSNAPTSTAKPSSNSGIFAFGANKTGFGTPAPSFGQNAVSNSVFGANVNSSSSPFASFPNAKQEQPSLFANQSQPSFGQNSAPASFGAPASTGFNFGGSSSAQPQAAAPFTFSAAPQPQAPAPTTFSCVVPSSFNFTGGTTGPGPVKLTAEPSSVTPDRKFIKAYRRTQQR